MAGFTERSICNHLGVCATVAPYLDMRRFGFPITISTMRGLLFAAAVLVVAVLLDSTLYDSRYLTAITRMVADISVHLWGK
jgi:hypothetical protein